MTKDERQDIIEFAMRVLDCPSYSAGALGAETFRKLNTQDRSATERVFLINEKRRGLIVKALLLSVSADL